MVSQGCVMSTSSSQYPPTWARRRKKKSWVRRLTCGLNMCPMGPRQKRMVLPRMSALAEVLWSSAQARSLGDFVTRLETFIPFLEEHDYQVANSHYKPEIILSCRPMEYLKWVWILIMGLFTTAWMDRYLTCNHRSMNSHCFGAQYDNPRAYLSCTAEAVVRGQFTQCKQAQGTRPRC